MRGNTVILNKWQGYYSEDCQCIYCLHRRRSKPRCPYAECRYLAEKLEAAASGRIERKEEMLQWDG
jgi:hypothetical protein